MSKQISPILPVLALVLGLLMGLVIYKEEFSSPSSEATSVKTSAEVRFCERCAAEIQPK